MNIIKNEIKIIDGRQYEYTEYDIFLADGTPYSETRYIQTQEEIQSDIEERTKQSRISELKEIITNKKLLDMNCTEEQTELRGLLGL